MYQSSPAAALPQLSRCPGLARALPARRWIKERKRFFPTSEATARREAEAAARRERGELDTARWAGGLLVNSDLYL